MNADITRVGAYKWELLKGLMATTFTALSLLLSFPSGAEESYPEELCNVVDNACER